jgi:hypothetical protein
MDFMPKYVHGRGKYISSDGKAFEGDWKNGIRDGNGNLTN